MATKSPTNNHNHWGQFAGAGAFPGVAALQDGLEVGDTAYDTVGNLLYICTNAGGPPATWVALAVAGGGNTLQQAYTAGNTIANAVGVSVDINDSVGAIGAALVDIDTSANGSLNLELNVLAGNTAIQITDSGGNATMGADELRATQDFTFITPADTTAADFSHITGNSSASGSSGGNISFTTGNATENATGGTFSAGTGIGAPGTAGNIPGAGGPIIATSGDGGDIGVSLVGPGGAGGAIFVLGGQGGDGNNLTASGAGSDITISAGDAGLDLTGPGARGGNVTISSGAGDGSNAASDSGNVSILGADNPNGQAGGAILAIGGDSTSSVGGLVKVQGGNATAGTADGGSIDIDGGTTAGGQGGSILMNTTTGGTLTVSTSGQATITTNSAGAPIQLRTITSDILIDAGVGAAPGNVTARTFNGNVAITAGGAGVTSLLTTTGAASSNTVSTTDGAVTVTAGGNARTLTASTTGTGSPVAVTTTDGNININANTLGAGGTCNITTDVNIVNTATGQFNVTANNGINIVNNTAGNVLIDSNTGTLTMRADAVGSAATLLTTDADLTITAGGNARTLGLATSGTTSGIDLATVDGGITLDANGGTAGNISITGENNVTVQAEDDSTGLNAGDMTVGHAVAAAAGALTVGDTDMRSTVTNNAATTLTSWGDARFGNLQAVTGGGGGYVSGDVYLESLVNNATGSTAGDVVVRSSFTTNGAEGAVILYAGDTASQPAAVAGEMKVFTESGDIDVDAGGELTLKSSNGSRVFVEPATGGNIDLIPQNGNIRIRCTSGAGNAADLTSRGTIVIETVNAGSGTGAMNINTLGTAPVLTINSADDIDIDAGGTGNITVDTVNGTIDLNALGATGTVDIDSASTTNITSGDQMTLNTTAGGAPGTMNIQTNGAAALLWIQTTDGIVKLDANGANGQMDISSTLNTIIAGTTGVAVTAGGTSALDLNAGIMTIDTTGGVGSMTFTTAGSTPVFQVNSADDIDLNLAGTGNFSVDTADGSIILTAVGAANGDITLSAADITTITSTDAVNITSTAGSIDIDSNNGSATLDGDANARVISNTLVTLDSNDNIEIQSGDAVGRNFTRFEDSAARRVARITSMGDYLRETRIEMYDPCIGQFNSDWWELTDPTSGTATQAPSAVRGAAITLASQGNGDGDDALITMVTNSEWVSRGGVGRFLCHLAVNTTLTNTVVRVGLGQTHLTASTHHALFTYEATGTVWNTSTNDGGVTPSTSTESTLTVDQVYKLEIVMGASDVQYWIDDVLVQTATTDLPGSSTLLKPMLYVQNSGAAAARDIDVYSVYASCEVE